MFCLNGRLKLIRSLKIQVKIVDFDFGVKVLRIYIHS